MGAPESSPPSLLESSPKNRVSTGQWVGWRHLGLRQLTGSYGCVLGSKREKKVCQNHILPSSPDLRLVHWAGGVRPTVRATSSALRPIWGIGEDRKRVRKECGVSREQCELPIPPPTSTVLRWQARGSASHGGSMERGCPGAH